MLQAMQSVRDEFNTMLKPSEVGVDQIPTSISKPGASKMDVYGPELPPGHKI